MTTMKNNTQSTFKKNFAGTKTAGNTLKSNPNKETQFILIPGELIEIDGCIFLGREKMVTVVAAERLECIA